MLSNAPIWIDIENPPQVQYLAPFVQAFHRRGRHVIVSARDTGITLDLLAKRAIDYSVVGVDPPARRVRKLIAVGHRAMALRRVVRNPDPAAVLCSSRPAAILARARRIPCFVVCDYEFAELGLYRRAGATILHPAVVPSRHFEALGFPRERLIGFHGVKEDISFAGIDVDGESPYEFGDAAAHATKVLVRPPAESSHYFDPRSRALVLALLDYLAAREDVLTVFSPRHRSQIADVEARRWEHPPVILSGGVPFVPLLKGVDRVVSAGGTMLREAAYLGVPAFSLFAGRLGAVDDYLRRTGRLQVLRSATELEAITAPRDAPSPFPRNERVIDELADAVLARAA